MKFHLTFLVLDVLLAIAYPILYAIQWAHRFFRIKR